MGLRDVGATLPPGFRFYPSDEELVCHYLHKKIANEEVLKGTLVEIDLHTCEPWHLPEVAKLNSSEWYFFSFRDRKYATGYRTNRATTCGYWKATGKDRVIRDPKTRAVVGMRKTLVFYRNRAPNGIKSGWIMHEFRLENPHMPPKEDWVLCRVFHKGPKGDNPNYNKLSPQNLLENSTTATSISPYFPTHDHTILPCDHHHCTTTTTTTTTLSPPQEIPNPNPSSHCGCSLSNPSIDPHQASAMENTAFLHVNSKCEDDYGFLFDMSFEGSSLGDGGVASPNFGEMRFGNEDDDNGSLIFI